MIAFPPDAGMIVAGKREFPADEFDAAGADDDRRPDPRDPASGGLDDDYTPAPLLDPDGVAADLGPGGPIAVALASTSGATAGGYEDRVSQRAMAARIAGLYNSGGVALLEAGTGVGKSLAYLVPALRWAAVRGERTVVSTNTINLQEQLVGKDLPLLASALTDQPVRFALLKGWRNYLCLHRLEHAQGGGLSVLDPEQDREMIALVAWAKRTEDGSLADAPRPPPRAEVWDEVAAEPDLCLRQQCPHYDACFVFRARRIAAQADVVVVNHHLLMSDVVVRRVQHNWHEAAVIPAYTRLIVDEGHHLENAAAAHLGSTVTRRGWQRLIARLERRGGKGLLARLAAVLRGLDDPLAPATVDLLGTTILPATVAARERGELVFDLLGAVLADVGEMQLRLDGAFARHPVWAGGLTPALDDLLGATIALDDALRLIQARHGGDQLQNEPLARVLGELRGVGRRLTASASALREGLAPSPTSEPSVRWIERRRGARDHGGAGMDTGAGANIGVCAVPLDLAPILREDLFKRVETAVITSATLAAEGRFDFLAGRLGVDGPGMHAVTEVFLSPFDYTRQALLAVPTDIPAPNVDSAGHAEAVVRIIRDLVRAAGGGIFVLFTSHRDVRAAAAALATPHAESPIAELLVQGDYPRDALLQRFRACGNAVLLGTASFWEGVDVPGRALRALVIPRLPFRVPSEPLTAAQCERIVARGGDPFVEYMLPQASLRLNQGFGRLIRSTTDRGVVVLADPRIVTKGYGRDLLRGLPPARRIAGPWSALQHRIETFFHSDTEPS